MIFKSQYEDNHDSLVRMSEDSKGPWKNSVIQKINAKEENPKNWYPLQYIF